MEKYSIGVDIGGTEIKLGLFNSSGILTERWTILTRRGNQSQYVLPDVAESILKKLEEKSIVREAVLGIGYGVPGIVTADGVVLRAGNLGWRNKHVTRELSELTGFSVTGGNDVKTAALGEMWRGAATGYKNVVLITLGTGIGGAIITDGSLVVGANRYAGEIGHMNVEDNCSIPCSCGRRGCLEQFGSATGVARMAREMLSCSNRPSILRDSEINAKAVFDAVKACDVLAVEVAERFGKYLGKALAGVALTVDPEIILIGGGVSKAGEIVLQYIRKYYQAYSHPELRNLLIETAKLGNDAGIYGAASYYINGSNR